MITNEIKAKVFAQYLGQSMWDTKSEEGEERVRLTCVYENGCVADEHGNFEIKADEVKLILKPLSAISDEDAIEVAKIIDNSYKDTERESIEIKRLSGYIFISTNKCDDACNIRFFTIENINISCIHEHTWNVTTGKAIQIMQYLQSKGYDLSNFHLGGKTLHEAGLAIYEKELTK